MKKICKKAKGRSGLTLVEMIAAVAVLSIMASVLSTGLAVATRSYRESVFVSDSAVLADTINTAMSDVLRYAAFQKTEDGVVYFANEEYNIPSSGRVVNEEGRIYIQTEDTGNKRLIVNSGAYTSLDVRDFLMDYDDSTNTYSATYTVSSEDGALGKACAFAYRSLR